MKRWVAVAVVAMVCGAKAPAPAPATTGRADQDEASKAKGVGTWTATDRHGNTYEIEVFAEGTIRVLDERRDEVVLDYKWLDEKRVHIETPFGGDSYDVDVAFSGDEMTLTDSQGRKLTCRRTGKPVDKTKTLGKWIATDSRGGLYEFDVSGDGTIRVTGDREATLHYRWLDAKRIRIDDASIRSSVIVDVAVSGDEMTLTNSSGRVVRCRRSEGGGAESLRIARNERSAAGSLKTICTAEADLRSNDRDNNRVQDFWTGDIAGLYCIDNSAYSDNPTPNKLIEVATALADYAPWNDGLHVNDRNYYSNPVTSFGKRAPKTGYWFQMMKQYTTWDNKREDYRTHTGGAKEAAYHTSRFGVCAFPADYPKSGRKTFIVSEGNTMFWKDTDGKPVEVWPSDEELRREWKEVAGSERPPDNYEEERRRYEEYMRREAEERRKREEEKKKEAAQGFRIDPWGSWNQLEVGSFVVIEMVSDYGGNKTKMTWTKTLDKKGEEHVLKTEMVMTVGGTETKNPGEERVSKMRDWSDMECFFCKRKGCTGNLPKWSKGELTVDGRKIACDVAEMPEKNCRGEANSYKFRTWYSNDVPGQMVKMESEAGGGKTTMVVVKFEARRK
ncbi:MAG: DUF2950 family protein [Planctomycetes bacterium]|nr:DUF2950 family protein [Planctomycetota bacterium]